MRIACLCSTITESTGGSNDQGELGWGHLSGASVLSVDSAVPLHVIAAGAEWPKWLLCSRSVSGLVWMEHTKYILDCGIQLLHEQ